MKTQDQKTIYFSGKFYDLAVRGMESDIPFYLEYARIARGPVLELACGTGRITLPIAREGIDITGLDISPRMVEIARKKAEKEQLNIKWILQDASDFNAGQVYNLIFFPFNSLCHLYTFEELKSCLESVKRHLTPKGRFVFDIFNPRMDILSRTPGKLYDHSNYFDPEKQVQVRIMESNRYDKALQINHIKLHYFFGDESEEKYVEDLYMRIYYPQEIEAILKYNGFIIEHRWGDFDRSFFNTESPRQIMVSRPDY